MTHQNQIIKVAWELNENCENRYQLVYEIAELAKKLVDEYQMKKPKDELGFDDYGFDNTIKKENPGTRLYVDEAHGFGVFGKRGLGVCERDGVINDIDIIIGTLGKAGASRHLGRRPKVRGVVMNPIDHPHGGGEGKTAAGRHPVTPWGKPTKGGKTRSKKKPSNSFIVKRRK